MPSFEGSMEGLSLAVIYNGQVDLGTLGKVRSFVHDEATVSMSRPG